MAALEIGDNMRKHLLVIALELVLIVAIGLVGNLATNQLNINGAYVWIALVVLLLILIPTTWFRVGLETNLFSFKWKNAIPETVTFSFSLSSIRKSLRILGGLILNGALFGWVTAFASIFAVRTFPELRWTSKLTYASASLLGTPTASSFEILGVFTIGFASVFVSKRVSPALGIALAVTSSLSFSITHLMMVPYQSVGVTLLGNLASSLLLLALGWITFPIWRSMSKSVVGFWADILKK